MGSASRGWQEPRSQAPDERGAREEENRHRPRTRVSGMKKRWVSCSDPNVLKGDEAAVGRLETLPRTASRTGTEQT